MCFVSIISSNFYLVDVLKCDNHRLDIINVSLKYLLYYLACIKTLGFTQRKLMKGINKAGNFFVGFFNVLFYTEKNLC